MRTFLQTLRKISEASGLTIEQVADVLDGWVALQQESKPDAPDLRTFMDMPKRMQ